MQSRGSLAETSLRNLLEAAQGERSTGTLTVRDGSGKSASLYFALNTGLEAGTYLQVVPAANSVVFFRLVN